MDRNTVSVTLAAAEIRWGSAVAAVLGACSVTGQPGAWHFVAEVVSVHKFRIAQQPLKVVTPNGWTWNVDSLSLGDGTLTAQVSPREPNT